MAYRLLRALAATVALAAIVVGLPILLVSFGRSPLDGIGSFGDQLHTVLTNPIDDAVALGLVTLITWGLWALFVAQLAVETTIALGRTTSWRPPLSGMFELGARQLIAAATMAATLTTTLGQRSSASPNLEPRTTATLVIDNVVPAAAVATAPALVADAGSVGHAAFSPGQAAVAPAPGVPVAGPVVTVVPGDSPWELAERHLGEGFRWREIWDLNRGVQQPDGHAWVEEDLIRPGWQLCMPGDAVGLEPPTPQAPAPAPPPPPTSEPEPVAESTHEAPATVTTTSTSPDGGAVADDDPDTSAEPAGEDDPDAEDGGAAVPWAAEGLLGVAGMVLASAVLRELRRRRTRRDVQTPAGMLPSAPPQQDIDRELLRRANEPAVGRLETALAQLAGSLHPRPGQPCPQPQVVLWRGGQVELMMEPPHPSPPAPWRAEAAGLFWVLDEDHELPPTGDSSPMPALATVGVDDGELLVDLEAFGVVALVGDPAACERLARSVAVELSSRSEGVVRVEIVGDLLDDATVDLEGVRRRPSWDDVDVRVLQTSSGLLETGGWPHTWAARSSGRIYDGWAPTVWVTDAADHPALKDTVAELAGLPGQGAAMLFVGGDPGCGLRIHVAADGRFDIPSLGLSGRTQGVDAEVAEQVVELLADADKPATTPLQLALPGEEVESDASSGGSATDDDHAPGLEELPYRVLVRLCGDIRVDGVDEHLTQRHMSIVTYVALKGSGDIERVRDAVWDGVAVTGKRVQNVMSEVRMALGDAMTSPVRGSLLAGDGLVTDTEVIRRRLAHAETLADPQEKIDVLGPALDLVTGPVCGYPTRAAPNWRWLSHGNWRSYVEGLVTAAATQLAQAFLDTGQYEDVRAVTKKGMDAVGRREDLVVLLTRSYEAAGDYDTARSVIRDHEAYLADLGVDEFNEDLLALMDRYSTPNRHKDT